MGIIQEKSAFIMNDKISIDSDEDFIRALRSDYKKIDIERELKVVDLTAGGKIQPYVKGLQIENELKKNGDTLANHVKNNPKAKRNNKTNNTQDMNIYVISTLLNVIRSMSPSSL